MTHNDDISMVFITNIYGHKVGSGYAGSVYGTEGVAPALSTMNGGNRQPMIAVADEEDQEAEGNHKQPI